MVTFLEYEIVNGKHTYASLNKRYQEEKRQSYNAIRSHQLQFNVKLCDKWIQRNGKKYEFLKKKGKIKLTMAQHTYTKERRDIS